jgi:F0F1-type ATP synthase membrane subunit b/b'
VIPDLTTAWVIAFVLVLSVLLDRLLLRPVTRVMRERQGAIRAAGDLAEASRARAKAAASELDGRTREARADVYRQMDEKRRTALERRAELVASTRREVEQSIAQATARVRAQAGAARAQLDRDANALASTIVERVLGRKAS